jgi:hypothetical protein
MIARIPINTSPGPDTLKFLTFNLGANPNLSPKEQMAYTTPDTFSNLKEDVTVFGGLFQWGRKDIAHSLRCAIADKPEYFTENTYTTAYNPATSTKFVWNGPNGIPGNVSSNNNDWYYPHTAARDFWGNGGGAATQTATTYTGTQNLHNPCPQGWRVPTQYEWALIGQENGDPSNPSDSFGTSTNGVNGTLPNNGQVYWVPVNEGQASASWEAGKNCGYALYLKSVWEAARAAGGYFDNSGTPDMTRRLTASGAPEPLMFLPAGGLRYYSDGGVYNTGNRGYYWSSTVDSSGARGLYFYSSSVVTSANTRALGMAVRCLAE